MKSATTGILIALLFLADPQLGQVPSTALASQSEVSKETYAHNKSGPKESAGLPAIEITPSPPALGVIPFIVSRIDEAVRKQFEQAWQSARWMNGKGKLGAYFSP